LLLHPTAFPNATKDKPLANLIIVILSLSKETAQTKTAKATLFFTTMYVKKIYWILNLIDHEKSHHYVYYSQQFIQLRKNRAKNF
jgi:hypothetical protein